MENFRETFKVDDDLSFDEVHRLFKFTYENNYVILPSENIISCGTTTDVRSLDKNLFHSENVPIFGSIPFVNDLKEFSKAVLENDIILSISFYDHSKNLIHYKKSFPSQSEEAYELSRKINRLTE